MVARDQQLRFALAVPALAVAWATSAIAAKPAGSKIGVSAAAPATIVFDTDCTPGQRITIAAVGDLLFHDALQLQAYRPGGSFRQFWAPVAAVLSSADITYGNLESPIAAGVRPGGVAHRDPGRVLDRIVYGRKSDALIFNVHPSVASDLVASGFTIVSTANNHAADRGSLGIDRTLDALTAAGLAHTGTRRRATPTPWHARTRANGITVAWLACTYGLNGMPDPHAQVLQCHRDRDAVLAEIRDLANDVTVDAVIVTPHWGEENQHRPTAREKFLARDMVEAGAMAVLGAHPHVLQPWEKLVTTGGREALVVYSLGNFISNQPAEAQKTGIVALLDVTRGDDGRTRLSAAGFVPTFVDMSRGHRVTELLPGRSAYEAVMRLLPAGNRVASINGRALPRACKPRAPTPARTPDVAMMAPPRSIEPAPPALAAPLELTDVVDVAVNAPPKPAAAPAIPTAHETGPPSSLSPQTVARTRPPPPPEPPRKPREPARAVRPTARGQAAAA